MAKQTKRSDWWSSTSAADDGDFDLEGDAPSSSWLDDFDFAEYESEPEDRIGDMWSRYSARGRGDSPDLRIVDAQKVVQGFVDTFATGDKHYTVVFDESVQTAGTDFRARKVIVSHKPLFDRTLTAEQANVILTAMAVHESSHVRYGRETAKAIETHPDPRAKRISNILDDVRIERRFCADYPGYADVFAPAIDYVANATTHGTPLDPSTLKGVNRVSAAVRYAGHVAWTPETVAERDWWLAWAERGSADDRVKTHLAAIDEALARLDAEPVEEQDEPEDGPSKTPGGSQPTQSGGKQSSSDTQQDKDEQDESASDASEDEDEESATSGGTQPSTSSGASDEGDGPAFPECYADAIADAAEGNGIERAAQDIDAITAQEMVEAGKALTAPDPVDGSRGEVYTAPGGIARSRRAVETNRSAVASIRRAFARSRTGHYGIERGLRSGRIDNKSLVRIASDDARLFARRISASEGKYRIWLMVDVSGSMDGTPILQASAVAAALASAVRFLPNVELDVWGWSSGFRSMGTWGAVRVYQNGGNLANIGYLPNVPQGGTPDAQVLRWAGKAIRNGLAKDVTPVILFATDGAGSLQGDQTGLVESLRKGGVEVYAVAIGYLTDAVLTKLYGEGHYISWQGSIGRTAKPLGDLVARIASGRR